jgi:hypothetical protein
MSDYNECKRCGDYSWGECRCQPYQLAQAWRGKVDDAEWTTVWGKDPESIVEAWAERYDSNGDYTIVSGSPQEVWIRDARDDDVKITKWEVTGESVPEYHATQLPVSERG